MEPSQIHTNDNTVVILGSDVNHIKNVLRMKPGEEIAVSNGGDGREYRCGIKELNEESILCELRFIKEDGVELPSRVHLYQGLPKADKMELIIQKTVELGVAEIIPVAMKRCVVKLDDKKGRQKTERWQAIAERPPSRASAASFPLSESPFLCGSSKEASDMEVKLLPYELAESMGATRKILENLPKGADIAVFIGPEGGFAPEEAEAAKAAGIEPVTLGKRILRTETAGLTVMAWIMYQLEEE